MSRIHFQLDSVLKIDRISYELFRSIYILSKHELSRTNEKF
jgi:hypothetical protein